MTWLISPVAKPMTDDDSSQGLFRVDTVPPPEGDDDAYSAPTKVGPMASSVIQEMILAAQEAADRAYEATKDQEPSEPEEAPERHQAETSRPPPTDEPAEAELRALDEHIPIAPSSMPGNASVPPVARSTSHPPSGASASALHNPLPFVEEELAPRRSRVPFLLLCLAGLLGLAVIAYLFLRLNG